jgi:predicted double-glycine peptidase
MRIKTFLFCIAFILNVNVFAFDQNDANRMASNIKVISWQSLRDKQIVKQKYDYSCGAASLATILSEYYSDPRTEKEILALISNGNATGASFYDMSAGLTKIGYEGIGFAATFEQLLNLKIPAIVYIKHRKTDHFSVLRGIEKDSVLLSDPSLGHITYSKEQFMRLWATREGRLVGKFFVVVPKDSATAQNKNYFMNSFTRQTAQAVKNFESNQLLLN